MSTIHANLAGIGFAGGKAASPRVHDHSKRVLLLLPLIWGLNLLDLMFTLLADTTREFVELNPLASPLGPLGRILLKLAALAIFTTIIIAIRRNRWAQWSCYVVLLIFGMLALVWLTMFPFLLSPCYFRLLASAF